MTIRAPFGAPFYRSRAAWGERGGEGCDGSMGWTGGPGRIIRLLRRLTRQAGRSAPASPARLSAGSAGLESNLGPKDYESASAQSAQHFTTLDRR